LTCTDGRLPPVVVAAGPPSTPLRLQVKGVDADPRAFAGACSVGMTRRRGRITGFIAG